MILVTGAAGFIGFHISKKLLKKGKKVLGVDNLNDYYDVSLKEKRVNELNKNDDFSFKKMDIADIDKSLMEDVEFIFHEAAYAGVRNSIEDPMLYDRVNVHDTVRLLKLSAETDVKKFMFASSSSVYGETEKFPTPETDSLSPKSPYGVSKLAAEKYCDAFYKCYGLNTISFRYFTVYGPWGRPDMAVLLAIKSCLEQKPYFKIFKKNGKIVPFTRDFSYIDDVVQANILAMESDVENGVYNVSAKSEVSVKKVIDLVEEYTGKSLVAKEDEPSPADPLRTLGDVSKITKELGYEPTTQIEEGIKKTIEWFKEYKGYE